MTDALAAVDAAAVVKEPVVADAGKPDTGKAADKPAADTKDGPSTLLDGEGDDAADTKSAPGAWPEDWRQRLAGKDKAELKALERFTDPANVWKKARSLEKKLAEKAALAVKPPEAASPEELTAWRAERGIPDKPEAYFDALKLPDGKVIGEADRPVLDGFAKAMHAANATPDQVAAAFNSYQEAIRAQADQQAEDDATFKVAERDKLREDWGAEFKPNLNATNYLFKEMPPEVREALLTARMPNGRMVGDSSAIVTWMASMAKELNPAATVVGGMAGKGTPKDRLDEIRTMRREKPDEYNNNRKALEAEEIQLLDADIKMQKRGRAA